MLVSQSVTGQGPCFTASRQAKDMTQTWTRRALSGVSLGMVLSFPPQKNTSCRRTHHTTDALALPPATRFLCWTFQVRPV